LSVFIAKAAVTFLDAPYETTLFAGFFAVFGHIFPVFFKFRGGKGVATLAGAAFALMPVITAALLILFAVIVPTTKIVSLASGICAAIFPVAAYFFASSHNNELFVFGCCCAALMIIKHLPNITRLLDGNERKI
jgi:glycerol-3-phosphate acyltransferase PlsY